MLCQLGSVMFEVWPVNITDTGRNNEAGLVDKPVLGRRPPVEFVGDGPETVTLSIKLFPEKLGGLSSLASLAAMRQSGQPQYMMRGDGVPMGWMAIERVSERSTHLNAQGVGRVIEVELSLRRTDAPNASDFFSSIVGLLE